MRELESLRTRLHELEAAARADGRGGVRDPLAESLGSLGTSLDQLRATSLALQAEHEGLLETRRLAEEERRRYEALFERERALNLELLEQLPLGLVIVDAQTGQTIRGNREFGAIWRRPLAELEHRDRYRHWIGFRPDGSRYAPESWPIARALRDGEIVTGERIQIVRGDGTCATIEADAAPIRDDAGTIVAGVAILHDVTEREGRERAAREFVVNAAHELRTPLAGVTAALEVLRSGAKHDPHDRDRFLAHIEHESDRLVRLTTALLTLARAEGGHERAPTEVVRLLPLLEQLARRLSLAPGVALEVDCPPDAAALANGGLMEQALRTILDNAARYTVRGRIRLAAEPLADDRIAVSVSDTGPGIPEDLHERVFERFFRASRDGDGFGIGLSIARAAVRTLGGEVELSSEPGRGTTLRVLLPAARVVSSA